MFCDRYKSELYIYRLITFEMNLDAKSIYDLLIEAPKDDGIGLNMQEKLIFYISDDAPVKFSKSTKI